MTFRSVTLLMTLALGTLAPAAAEMITLTADGRITSLGDADRSAFALTDRVQATISFNLNDLYEIDDTGFSFVAMGPGAALDISIGSQRWTLADYAASFAPAPLLRVGGEQLELIVTAFNGQGSFLFTGLNRFGFGAPGSFWFGEPGGDSFANVGQLGEFRETVGTVPEPETWMVLITGLAMTGVALRRRRLRLA